MPLLLLTACAALFPPLDELFPSATPATCPEPAEETDAPSCQSRPDLCDLLTVSEIRDPDLDQAYDLVFVPDGYTRAELPDFDAQVSALVDGLELDSDGIVDRAPALFNVHRVELASASDEVDDADRLNTALGGCHETCADGESQCLTAADDAAVLAASNAPDVDVVIVVLRTASGRANASSVDPGEDTPIVHLGETDGDRTLTHELGHALFGLGDEYDDGLGAYPHTPAHWMSGPTVLSSPNLSPEDDGARWEGLVTGAVEGGNGYGTGIWHPTEACRMNDHDADAFCPVCSAAIDEALGLRLDGGSDGPPLCWAGTPGPQGGAGGYEVEYAMFDRDGVGSFRLTVEEADGTREVTSERLGEGWWTDGAGGGTADALVGLTLTCTDAVGEATEVAVSLE